MRCSTTRPLHPLTEWRAECSRRNAETNNSEKWSTALSTNKPVKYSLSLMHIKQAALLASASAAASGVSSALYKSRLVYSQVRMRTTTWWLDDVRRDSWQLVHHIIGDGQHAPDVIKDYQCAGGRGDFNVPTFTTRTLITGRRLARLSSANVSVTARRPVAVARGRVEWPPDPVSLTNYFCLAVSQLNCVIVSTCVFTYVFINITRFGLHIFFVYY